MSDRRLFVLGLLAVELLDELCFSVREASWPRVRDELGLSYAEVGLLLGLPNLLAAVLEPLAGVAGDRSGHRRLVLAGGVFFGLALLATGLATGFWTLLAAAVVLYPASGAFVSLSQATLMDAEPQRREQNMARWAAAGSVGMVAGSLAAGAAAALGLDWRALFLGLAALAAAVLGLVARLRWPAAPAEAPAGAGQEQDEPGLLEGLRAAFGALRRREVLRWLVLLQASDLMLDVLLGFLALYVVDVAGGTAAQGALAVAVWTGVGLLGDLLLVPLLERVDGLRWLRLSAMLTAALFGAFLLVPGLEAKLVLLGLLGLVNAGWYPILKARLYAQLPGRSGTAMALGSVSSLAGGCIPLTLGLLAGHIGLGGVLWLLLAGPLALLAGLPRRNPSHTQLTEK